MDTSTRKGGGFLPVLNVPAPPILFSGGGMIPQIFLQLEVQLIICLKTAPPGLFSIPSSPTFPLLVTFAPLYPLDLQGRVHISRIVQS